MFRPSTVLVASLALLGGSCATFTTDDPNLTIVCDEPRRADTCRVTKIRPLFGTGPFCPSRTHGYIPHPNAFRTKRRRFKPSRFSHRGPKAQRRRV